MSVFTNPADGAPSAAATYVEAVLGMLGDREARPVLAAAPGEFREVVAGVDDGRLLRPESPGRWSVGQVLAHMVDSDLVWAWRLRLILAHDRPTLGGYDQDVWARRLRYEDVDPRASLERFAQVRSINLDLLDRLPDTDFDRVGVHAERGEENVRHLMRLYAGHDLVHLAQARRILSADSSTEE
ncbi:MAG: DinB family protein [Gemmatimonadales bacterium]|jgi:hypothetical protein